MINLSMVQALNLWSDLEAAHYGENGFGGHTAEIYIYRCMPNEPSASAHRISEPGTLGDASREAYGKATRSLYALLVHFQGTHDAEIEINGRLLGPWFADLACTHRVHVTVTPRTR